MAITDTGVPATDPHTMLSNLLTNNMASPGDGWTPVVNAKWFEHKKQKTYQIAITAIAEDTETAHLTGGHTTTQPKISTALYQISLYHQDRAKHWALFRKVMLVLNNETLTSPQNSGGLVGVNDYHWIRVGEVSPISMVEDTSGIDRPDQVTTGYQSTIDVRIRWNE